MLTCFLSAFRSGSVLSYSVQCPPVIQVIICLHVIVFPSSYPFRVRINVLGPVFVGGTGCMLACLTYFFHVFLHKCSDPGPQLRMWLRVRCSFKLVFSTHSAYRSWIAYLLARLTCSFSGPHSGSAVTYAASCP